MDANFNWKPYLITIIIVSVLVMIFNFNIGIGIVIGTVFYFINDRINLKKFPRLDTNMKAVGSMLGLMFVQGIFMIIGGLISYFIGGLASLLSCFLAQIVPSIFFIIKGARK